MVKANWWRPLPALALLAVAAALSVSAGVPYAAGRAMSEFEEAARSDGKRLDALEVAIALLRAERDDEVADMIGAE